MLSTTLTGSGFKYCARLHDSTSEQFLHILIHPTQEMLKKKAIFKLYIYIFPIYLFISFILLSIYLFIRDPLVPKRKNHLSARGVPRMSPIEAVMMLNLFYVVSIRINNTNFPHYATPTCTDFLFTY